MRNRKDLLQILEVKCKGNSQMLIVLYVMGQGLEYKIISFGCHIVFVVLKLNVVTSCIL
jgi:hypothetical protein